MVCVPTAAATFCRPEAIRRKGNTAATGRTCVDIFSPSEHSV
jgi:hypothetical protein